MDDMAFEVENNLIGALLKNPDQLLVVKEIITPGDFKLERAKWAYESMLILQDNGLTIDTVTLGDELERHNQLSEWGGRLALGVLRENFRGDNPVSYAFKVLDYAAKRRLLQEASEMALWSKNGRNSSDIRNDMIRRLTEIKTPNARMDQHTATLKESLSGVYDEVSNGNVEFVPTGFTDLDKLLDGGLYAPDLTLIAARPGQGKTSLLLSVAKNAIENNKRVLMFTLEMSNSQVTMRLISQQTGIPFGAMRQRKMTKDEWEKFNDAIENMEDLPFHLNDLPAIKVNQMRQVYRKLEAVHGKMDLVLVDYLQLQEADGDYNTREQEVSSVSRGLKAMAKEFNVPIFAAAQLSRAVEQRSDKRPVLSDLRESGSLEMDSDNVLFIYRPEEYEKDSQKYGVAEIICAKHRNGATGTIDLVFRKTVTRFENAARANIARACGDDNGEA